MTLSFSRLVGGIVVIVGLVAACGGDGERSVTLVAYDSFPTVDTALNEALDEFTATTGIGVEILTAGDTGTMVSKAILTAGTPEGDVIWGVDDANLVRALDIFEPYTVADVDALDAAARRLAPDDLATPVTIGDVCVNVDLEWFRARDLVPPGDLEDLADPAYSGLLVVQNPATSSPGLAFLLASVAAYGDGWVDYWQRLRDNDVAVTDGWTEAYYERFSWAGGGDRPLVVSYGSSPPAEVIFADPPRTTAPTGVIEATCYRQVEFAGILRGTDRESDARALLDFLVSERFQTELPLTLFVAPARTGVTLPPEFVEFAVVPAAPLSVDPVEIENRRVEWIDEWSRIVLG